MPLVNLPWPSLLPTMTLSTLPPLWSRCQDLQCQIRPNYGNHKSKKKSEHDSHRKVPAFFPWSFCFSIWALVSWLASNTLTKSTAWYWRLPMELLILAEMLILHDVAAFRLTTLLYFTQFDSISIIFLQKSFPKVLRYHHAGPWILNDLEAGI